MNLNEYRNLCSTITNNIAREIKRRYPNLTVEVIQDDYYSRVKVGNLFLNIDYPTLDYNDIYRDGSATIYLTKEISTPVEKPQVDRGVVRMPTMNRVRTKKSNVNYNGNIEDPLSLINYLSKVKMFKDEISNIKESVNKRVSRRSRRISESNRDNLLKDFVETWNFHLNHPRMEIMSPTIAVGNGHTTVCIAELKNGMNEIHLRTFKKVKDEFISESDFEDL